MSFASESFAEFLLYHWASPNINDSFPPDPSRPRRMLQEWSWITQVQFQQSSFQQGFPKGNNWKQACDHAVGGLLKRRGPPLLIACHPARFCWDHSLFVHRLIVREVGPCFAQRQSLRLDKSVENPWHSNSEFLSWTTAGFLFKKVLVNIVCSLLLIYAAKCTRDLQKWSRRRYCPWIINCFTFSHKSWFIISNGTPSILITQCISDI